MFVASLGKLTLRSFVISLSVIALFFSGVLYVDYNEKFYFLFYAFAGVCLFCFRVKKFFLPSLVYVVVLMLLGFGLNKSSSSAFIFATHLAFILMSYVVASSKQRLEPLLYVIYRIHVVFVMFIAFFNIFAPDFAAQMFSFAVVFQDGSNRISGFATEPSYEAFLIAFLWFILFKRGEMSDFWSFFGVASLLFLESLFGVLLAALITVELLSEKRMPLMYKSSFFVVGILVSLVQLGDSYLSDKISAFFSSFSDLENGPGAVRLAPYVYLNQVGWIDALSFLGNGAGTFGARYFDEYGFLITDRATLSGHMAELLYDYGIILFASLFTFCCAYFPSRVVVSVPLTLLVFLNTGVGSYLFVTYLIAVLQGVKYAKEAT